MKFSNVLKVFGAAALVAGLTPYRITRDEETGEKRIRALFWEATKGPKAGGEESELSVQLGFFSPGEQENDEPHFFADELTVEYNREDMDVSGELEAEEEKAAEEAEEAGEAAVEEAAAEAAEEAEEDEAEKDAEGLDEN